MKANRFVNVSVRIQINKILCMESLTPLCHPPFLVNVWDRALAEDEISRIANCQEDMQGNYVS